jgi:hypothetical protein
MFALFVVRISRDHGSQCKLEKKVDSRMGNPQFGAKFPEDVHPLAKESSYFMCAWQPKAAR